MAHHTKWATITIAVLILVLLGALAYFMFFVQSRTGSEVTNTLQDQPLSLEGKLTALNTAITEQLAGAPQDLRTVLETSRLYFILSDKKTKLPQSYTFSKNTFTQTDEEDEMDMYYSSSLDGSKTVFFAATKERQALSHEWGTNAELYSADTASLTDEGFAELEHVHMRDNSSIPFKQHPSISNGGDILFVGWEQVGTPSVGEAEDWSIYKVTDGKAEFLVHGFMPKWINNDEFLFLKNDGLYKAAADLSSVEKIASSYAEVVHSNNRFDIDHTGSSIAWTQPEFGRIEIFEVQQNVLTSLVTLDATAFWVTFSPDASYLAVQTIAKGATGFEESPKAKIEFFDMRTFEKVSNFSIDLDAFDQMYMFMTEWISV